MIKPTLLIACLAITLTHAGVVTRVRVNPNANTQNVRLSSSETDSEQFVASSAQNFPTHAADRPQGRLIRVVPNNPNNNQQRHFRQQAPSNSQQFATLNTNARNQQPVINRVLAQPLPLANQRQAESQNLPRTEAAAESSSSEEDAPVVHTPYNNSYESVDNNGATQKREETKDDKGVVRGSYSYTDPNGVFRVVEYIADENGFRASIRTNEPGIGKNELGDPSGVIYEIDPTPQAVVDETARNQEKRVAARAAARSSSASS